MDELLKGITSDPGIFEGRPMIRGMRFRVQDVLKMLASGMKPEEILKDFPYLEADDIKACLKYAALKPHHPILSTC